MPAKKYQVFISSTFTDLVAERQAAVEAILKAGHIPAGMELFAAGDQEQWKVIQRWIDQSDIFMLILGGRYGSIDPATGLSYTEMEYDYAVRTNKPFFALVFTDDAIERRVKESGSGVIERNNGRKLDNFRKKVLGKISRLVIDDKDIRLETVHAINDIDKNRVLSGWVSASEIAEARSELAELRNQNAALKNDNDSGRNSIAALRLQITQLERTVVELGKSRSKTDLFVGEFPPKAPISSSSVPAEAGARELSPESHPKDEAFDEMLNNAFRDGSAKVTDELLKRQKIEAEKNEAVAKAIDLDAKVRPKVLNLIPALVSAIEKVAATGHFKIASLNRPTPPERLMFASCEFGTPSASGPRGPRVVLEVKFENGITLNAHTVDGAIPGPHGRYSFDWKDVDGIQYPRFGFGANSTAGGGGAGLNLRYRGASDTFEVYSSPDLEYLNERFPKDGPSIVTHAVVKVLGSAKAWAAIAAPSPQG